MESKKELGTTEQSTIDRVIKELDVDVGILITADINGVSMSAASKETSGSLLASEWMDKISQFIFKKDFLTRMKVANKIPI